MELRDLFHDPKKSPFTRRQLEVIKLAAEGWDNTFISKRLRLSYNTVAIVFHAIYEKMAVSFPVEGKNHRGFLIALYCYSKYGPVVVNIEEGGRNARSD